MEPRRAFLSSPPEDGGVPPALVQTRLTLASLWTRLVVWFGFILIRWAISSER